MRGAVFVRLLQRHGLTRRSARALQVVAREIQVRTEEHGIEFAALIDANTGEQLGPILGGISRTVDARPLLRAMQPVHEYVEVHSHPESSAFSWQDAGILARNPALRATLIISADGTSYALSRVPGALPPTIAAIRSAYLAGYTALLPRYRELVQSGAASAHEAWREHSHEIWQRVSNPLNLRYDRLEPK